MDEGLDTGDMLVKHRLPIADDDTGGSLHDKLAQFAPATLEEGLDLICAGNPPRETQDETLVTHVRKLTRADGKLDWNRPAIELARLVRAFTPWPGTYCLLGEAKMKVHRAAAIADAGACAAPGTVVSANADGSVISCNGGLLSLLEVQIEGGKRLPAADFLRGHPLEAGATLG